MNSKLELTDEHNNKIGSLFVREHSYHVTFICKVVNKNLTHLVNFLFDRKSEIKMEFEEIHSHLERVRQGESAETIEVFHQLSDNPDFAQSLVNYVLDESTILKEYCINLMYHCKIELTDEQAGELIALLDSQSDSLVSFTAKLLAKRSCEMAFPLRN